MSFLATCVYLRENLRAVWPPNASLYASSTCVHLRLLAIQQTKFIQETKFSHGKKLYVKLHRLSETKMMKANDLNFSKHKSQFFSVHF